MKTFIIRTVYPLNEKGERQEPVSFKGMSDEIVKAFADTMYPNAYEMETATFNVYDSVTGAIEEITTPKRCRQTPPCGISVGSTEKLCPWCSYVKAAAKKRK